MDDRSSPHPMLRTTVNHLPRAAIRILPALVLLPTLGACGEDPATVATDELPSALVTAQSAGPEWSTVKRAAFAFRFPPGFVEAGEQVSRTMGRYVRDRDGTTLFFNYGQPTRGLRPPQGATGVRQAWSSIGGRRVHLAVWTVDGSRIVRAWWPRVGARNGEVLGLLLGGAFTADAARDDLLVSIRSVRFR